MHTTAAIEKLVRSKSLHAFIKSAILYQSLTTGVSLSNDSWLRETNNQWPRYNENGRTDTDSVDQTNTQTIQYTEALEVSVLIIIKSECGQWKTNGLKINPIIPSQTVCRTQFLIYHTSYIGRLRFDYIIIIIIISSCNNFESSMFYNVNTSNSIFQSTKLSSTMHYCMPNHYIVVLVLIIPSVIVQLYLTTPKEDQAKSLKIFNIIS